MIHPPANILYADDILLSSEASCTTHPIKEEAHSHSNAGAPTKIDPQISSLQEFVDDYSDASILSDDSDWEDCSLFTETTCSDEPAIMELQCQKAQLMDRMEQKFEERRKTLREIRKEVGKGSSLYKYLKKNEEFTKRYCRSRLDPDADLNKQEEQDLIQESVVGKIIRMLRFEQHFALPGVIGLVMYGICHVCVFELVSLCYYYFFDMEHVSIGSIEIPLIYFSMIFGIIIFRVSGTPWYWLSEKRYKSSRFAFHNKAVLGDFDVSCQKWLNKHSKIQLCIEVLAFYMMYLSIYSLFHERLVPDFCDIEEDVFINLPSVQNNGDSFVLDVFLEKSNMDIIEGYEEYFVDEIEEEWPEYEFLEKFTEECDDEIMCCIGDPELDFEYMYDTLSKSSYSEFLGDEDGPLYTDKCSFIVFASFGLFSMAVLSAIGLDFWR